MGNSGKIVSPNNFDIYFQFSQWGTGKPRGQLCLKETWLIVPSLLLSRFSSLSTILLCIVLNHEMTSVSLAWMTHLIILE